jgi:hypothetical protein
MFVPEEIFSFLIIQVAFRTIRKRYQKRNNGYSDEKCAVNIFMCAWDTCMKFPFHKSIKRIVEGIIINKPRDMPISF